MRLFFILFIVFYSASSFSAGFGFLDYASGFFNSIWLFFTVDVPNFILNIFLYILEYAILLKINSLIFFTEFAFSLSVSFLDSINLVDILNSSISQLDSDILQTLVDVRFFDGVQLIIEAFVARFILDMMGW